VAVAVFGVGGGAWRILAILVCALGVVLVGDVLGEVGRHHLANLGRPLLVHVLGAVAVRVSSALGDGLVVVAVHQGGMVVGGLAVVGEGRGHRVQSPGGPGAFCSICVCVGVGVCVIGVGCDIDGVRRVSGHGGRRYLWHDQVLRRRRSGRRCAHSKVRRGCGETGAFANYAARARDFQGRCVNVCPS
jgi:hypothetical protein